MQHIGIILFLQILMLIPNQTFAAVENKYVINASPPKKDAAPYLNSIYISELTVKKAGCGVPGCGTRKDEQNQPAETDNQCIPQWYNNPPPSEDGIYGTGIAKMQTPSLSKKNADTEAVDYIVHSIENKVQNTMDNFVKKTGIEKEAQDLQLCPSLIKQISSQVLHDCKIIKRKICSNGTWYSLAMWPKNNTAELKYLIKRFAIKSIKSDEELYNNLDLKNIFDILEEDIDKLDLSDGFDIRNY